MNMNNRIFIIAAMVIAATSILITGCFNKKTTGMKVTPSAIMIPVNINNSLSADIEPIEAMTSTSITWTISDPNIATIDKLSDDWVLIQPKNVGEAVVTAKTKKGDFTSSALVIINPVKIDDDFATQIPGFYFGNTKINGETVEINKLITIKYHDRNQMVFSIDDKFKLSRTENVECSIKVDYIADVTKEGEYSYKYRAAGEIDVTIDGKTYPATIEGIFSGTLDLSIKIKEVPELGTVTINFSGSNKYKVD
jgi:uncharacterized lipoprotein YajG